MQIRRIVAVIQLERARMHFENHVAGFIEKITVMRNDNRRAIPLRQITLQPFDCGDIEMIGRFIEQQQIGIG